MDETRHPVMDRPVNFAEAIKATGCLVCGKPIEAGEPTARRVLDNGATPVLVHRDCGNRGVIKVLVDPFVGCLVKLKSGGPLMTVESLLEGGAAKCVWFSEYTVERVTLPVATLTAVE